MTWFQDKEINSKTMIQVRPLPISFRLKGVFFSAFYYDGTKEAGNIRFEIKIKENQIAYVDDERFVKDKHLLVLPNQEYDVTTIKEYLDESFLERLFKLRFKVDIKVAIKEFFEWYLTEYVYDKKEILVHPTISEKEKEKRAQPGNICGYLHVREIVRKPNIAIGEYFTNVEEPIIYTLKEMEKKSVLVSDIARISDTFIDPIKSDPQLYFEFEEQK